MTKQSQPGPWGAERAALVVTNLTKLAGIVLAVNEALVEDQLRSEVLIVAAFMMAGAQALESVLTSFFGGKR